MVAFLLHILVTAVLLLLIAKLVPGVHIDGGGPAVFAAVVLGLANAFVRPILIVLTFPLTVITLGLFLFVINALMLLLAAKLVAGFSIDGFGSALIASLVLSLLNLVIAAVL